jgi:hypothetical protein
MAIAQVVLISSMGVTKPDHPLNRIGDGKILFWKRMAEEYLVNSGAVRHCSISRLVYVGEGACRVILGGQNGALLSCMRWLPPGQASPM